MSGMPKGAVFVFGSNRQGIHGAGAALDAKRLYGAIQGQGEGRMYQSYAIPTKATPYQTLPLSEIRAGVERFLTYARQYDDETFYVTRIGCGLAGYTDAQIGPMFVGATSNCILPEEWGQYRAS